MLTSAECRAQAELTRACARARGSDQETALAEPRRLHPKRQHRRNPLFPSHAIDTVSNRGAWACFLRRASGFVGFEKWSANIVDNIRPIPFKPKPGWPAADLAFFDNEILYQMIG